LTVARVIVDTEMKKIRGNGGNHHHPIASDDNGTGERHPRASLRAFTNHLLTTYQFGRWSTWCNHCQLLIIRVTEDEPEIDGRMPCLLYIWLLLLR